MPLPDSASQFPPSTPDPFQEQAAGTRLGPAGDPSNMVWVAGHLPGPAGPCPAFEQSSLGRRPGGGTLVPRTDATCRLSPGKPLTFHLGGNQAGRTELGGFHEASRRNPREPQITERDKQPRFSFHSLLLNSPCSEPCGQGPSPQGSAAAQPEHEITLIVKRRCGRGGAGVS